MTVIDGKAGMDFFNLLQCRMALDIEVTTGMRHSQGSVLAYVRRRFGVESRTKAGALAELVNMVEGAQAAKHGETAPGVDRHDPTREYRAFVRGYERQWDLLHPPQPVCQSCWQEANPDQYCPDLTDTAVCSRCADLALVVMVPQPMPQG